MTFEQLDCFIAAVECSSFFHAAETLHITQSTLSKQIMKLERELDLTLWDRSRRSAVLSPAGEVFYKEALHLMSEYRKSLATLEQFRETLSQTLRVGTLPILSQYQLSPRIHSFSCLHPEIHLSLTEVEEQELLNGLEQGVFDLIIARKNMLDLRQITFSPLAEDRIVAVFPTAHRLAGQTAVSVRELAGEPLLLMPSHTSLYRFCIELFTEQGIRPTVFQTLRAETLIGAAEAGEGIGLLAEESFRLFRSSRLTALPLTDAPSLSIGIARIKKRRLPTAAAAFVRTITAQTYKTPYKETHTGKKIQPQ